MTSPLDLLIVGAGPFGLSLAAYARDQGLDYLVVGRPMEFWQSNMPAGMVLRSGCDWHLDPFDVDTIEAYLRTRQSTPSDVEPLSLDFYRSYADWFQEQKQFRLRSVYVQRLDEGEDHFVATLDNGEALVARNVALALGFKEFKSQPGDLVAMLPSGRYGHTCDVVDLAPWRDRRVLVIGGRQSAFEWTALLREQGAAAVHVSYRHETPAFARSDWSWFNRAVAGMVDNPGWFRNLSAAEKEDVNRRFWEEGRLKLEPWLGPRIDHESVTLWPHTAMTGCEPGPSEALRITLSNGHRVDVDHVLLATGYKVNIALTPLLRHGNLQSRLAAHNGFPKLDEGLQTNVPGLYITSMPATQDFGLFFAFSISVRASAHLIGRAVATRL